MGVVSQKAVLKKVVKTPRTGADIGKLLGVSYRACSRILGEARKSGDIQFGTKGNKTGFFRTA